MSVSISTTVVSITQSSPCLSPACAIIGQSRWEEIRGMVSPVEEATGRCRPCGNDLRSIARFGDVSGSPVASEAVTEYKQVTVLFVDVVGSMKLAEALHPERLREIMNEL